MCARTRKLGMYSFDNNRDERGIILMKATLNTLAGLLVLCASLQASTSFTLNTGGSNSFLSSASPYSGSLNYGSGNIAYTIICDDFADEQSIGGSYTADVTNVGTGSLTNKDTRFGGSTSSTTLYDELVWLGTEMLNHSANQADQASIQEAIWALTGGAGAPTASYTGQTQTYAEWEQDAKFAVTGIGSYYIGTAANYTTPVYSNWLVITATDAVGCTSGTTGTTACNGPAVNQEFLAYTPIATPEPASFILLGSGLLAGAVFGRRRMVKSNS